MAMDRFPPALSHGQFEELFPDVFFVTGGMKTVLMGSDWQFSRNMTVVRDAGALTLINSVRLTDTGLAQLDALGRVANVVKIGSMHGRDDAFYRERYGARFWAPPGMVHEHGLETDEELRPGANVPFAGCSVFDFRTTKRAEAILHIDRFGGILISCDSLQNWAAPDEFFSEESLKLMTNMGFFQPANVGPLWMQLNEPQRDDFMRLAQMPFRHVLCGHGAPLIDNAREAYLARFECLFGSGQREMTRGGVTSHGENSRI
jgi:hypothetical protein